jgi:tetratricopeptide (TPR) repeat protein
VALGYLQEGLGIVRELGNQSAELEFLEVLVMVEREGTNLARARSTLEAALALQRALGKIRPLASLLIYAGDLAHYEGDDARARSSYQECLALGIDLEWAWRSLGYTALIEGDQPAARRYLRNSLEWYRNHGMPLGQVECLNGYAGLALSQQKWEKAGQILGAVVTLHRKLTGGTLHGRDRRESDRFVAAARAALGEQDFAAAWAAGEAMTLDQAVAYALEHSDG